MNSILSDASRTPPGTNWASISTRCNSSNSVFSSATTKCSPCSCKRLACNLSLERSRFHAMITPNETPSELTAEALGEAPGRGRLIGRRILVVGAGSAHFQGESDPPGNGQAIARLAAREGAEVICADINLDSAGRTVAAILAEGGSATALQGDVADADVCARLIADAGALDGLVCNVGIGLGRFLADTSPEQWDRVMAVNLRAH